MRFQYKRLVGYIAGFMLFYAPFAFFQKVVYYLYTGKWSEWTVHHFCLRIQLEHILDRSILDAAFISTSFLLLLLAAAFLCGPFFCGRPASVFFLHGRGRLHRSLRQLSGNLSAFVSGAFAVRMQSGLRKVETVGRKERASCRIVMLSTHCIFWPAF